MTAPPRTITTIDNRVPTDTGDRLTGLLQKVGARRGIHHANVAIMTGDGQHHWFGATSSTGSGDEPLTTETPFFIASVTKRFIVTLVLQAHERGELGLDAPIATYLPPGVTTGLHILRGTDHTPAITVRHLASHTSGLPEYFDKPRDGPSLYRQLAGGNDVSWSFEDMVRMAKEQHRPHFAPQDLAARRQKARYSDTGFQLLIRILETVTGRTFADLLTDRILQPMQLAHTWLPARSHPASATAAPSPLHARDRRVDLPGMITSSNDLISTTRDLITFQRALLAGELFHDPNTVALLTERRNRLRNIPSIRYGLGTMIFPVPRIAGPDRRPATLVGHSGATGTWLFHCAEHDLHLAGTVDQTRGQAIPFRLMMRMLRSW